jgi:hypothetical protein
LVIPIILLLDIQFKRHQSSYSFAVMGMKKLVDVHLMCKLNACKISAYDRIQQGKRDLDR